MIERVREPHTRRSRGITRYLLSGGCVCERGSKQQRDHDRPRSTTIDRPPPWTTHTTSSYPRMYQYLYLSSQWFNRAIRLREIQASKSLA